MPTPDASQFTQLKKYNAVQARRTEGEPQSRTLTHLHQSVPSVTNPRDFLASFSNKYVSIPRFIPINIPTGVQRKPRIPGGNANGQSGSGSITLPYSITTISDALFFSDEITFNRDIVVTSPFIYTYLGITNRFAHYFNLNLDPSYNYTFEILSAMFNVTPFNTDTLIVLFNSQNQPINRANEVTKNDDGDIGSLSKLSNQIISGNWCLAVTSVLARLTGTFRLKVTRAPIGITTTTNVVDASFSNDEALFSKKLEVSSPFGVLYQGSTNRYAHYFNLNLSPGYTYTFEATSASFNTLFYLFGNQTNPRTDAFGQIAFDDNGGVGSLSKLVNQSIPGNYSLVVTSVTPTTIGTFALKITRTSTGVPPASFSSTDVTESSFNTQGGDAIFDKSIVASSAFSVTLFGRSNRYAHYFNLTGLNLSRAYTFDITAASLTPGDPTDTLIALFNSQTLPLSLSNLVASNDDINAGNNNFLSRLTNQTITATSCLVVTTNSDQRTGTFTLRITR
jgi:hypothetical protein